MTALVMLLALFALVLINVPIAVALGLIAAVAMVWKSGADNLLAAAVTMFDGAKSFPLIAIPLFVLAGAIMNTSGISRRLIAFASALLGFISGGLSMVNIGTSMFFAEISGSAVADVAAIGSILMPAMEEARLSQGVRRRDHLVLGLARDHHPALDPDDPLRHDRRHLGRAAVRRRHHPRPDRRRRPDGHGLLVRGALQLAGRGGVPPQARLGDLQGRGLGVPAADHHPRRHLRRHRHRDRGRRRSRWSPRCSSAS